jgi:hypothetical protein
MIIDAKFASGKLFPKRNFTDMEEQLLRASFEGPTIFKSSQMFPQGRALYHVASHFMRYGFSNSIDN